MKTYLQGAYRAKPKKMKYRCVFYDKYYKKMYEIFLVVFTCDNYENE